MAPSNDLQVVLDSGCLGRLLLNRCWHGLFLQGLGHLVIDANEDATHIWRRTNDGDFFVDLVCPAIAELYIEMLAESTLG